MILKSVRRSILNTWADSRIDDQPSCIPLRLASVQLICRSAQKLLPCLISCGFSNPAFHRCKGMNLPPLDCSYVVTKPGRCNFELLNCSFLDSPASRAALKICHLYPARCSLFTQEGWLQERHGIQDLHLFCTGEGLCEAYIARRLPCKYL